MESATTTSVGTPNPNVKLPPAALRLENLDFDPTGNPYYKFPPFLSPPDGKELIPYDKFKPHGIQIALESDVEELDGEGIPTVELGVKHLSSREREKKKKTRPYQDGELNQISSWWEDWNEGEDLRRADSYDPNTARTDRFAQGAAEFAQNRRWSPALQSLYDYFRQHVGLLTHATKKTQFGRGDKQDQEVDEDDDDDEEELTVEEAKEKAATEMNPTPDVDDEESKICEIDPALQRKLEAEQEAKEQRMDMFLNDPELSIKVFFSSYYKDKGLFWSEPKLRDGPILLSFFFGFFIRNKIMPDYEKAFRKAYKATEVARLELPQTTKISVAMPDVFGSACTGLWGTKQPQAWKGGYPVGVGVGEAGSGPIQEWEKQLKVHGVEKIEVAPTESVQSEGGAWGTPVDGIDSSADNADPWMSATGTVDWGSGNEVPTLISVLGPTTIPLTHAPQLVEKSTRQIVSFAPPNPDGKGLDRVLGTMVLAPWKNCNDVSTIVPAELLTDRPEGSTFDPAKDVIIALVDEKTVEVLREGMGLHAVYVRVVESDGAKEPKDKKKSKSRSKGKAKAKGFDEKEWWYIDFLYEVVPSFWTDAT